MKKYAFLFLLLFFLSACWKDEDKTVDITVMPNETKVGANTFGCLIDGWLYVGGRYWDVYWMSPYVPSIVFKYNQEGGTLSVSVKVKEDTRIYFTIHNPEEGKQTSFTAARLGSEELPDGTVTVTRFDTEKQIISGRFEGGRITHGRFDVQYELWDKEACYMYDDVPCY